MARAIRCERNLRPLLALLASIGLGEAAVGAMPVPSLINVEGVGIERGIARVICERDGPAGAVRARAVVLDLGTETPRRDVLLAPAHVLPEYRARIRDDCWISGTPGAPIRIADFWLPDAGTPDLENDWVVVMTDSHLTGQVGRLRVGVVSDAVLEQLRAAARPLHVMLATPGADQRDCRILEMLERRVFSHSCRGWAGLSGSPIMAAVDGEPVMIGMHVAHMMRPMDSPGPLFRGVGRAIDAGMAAAIEQASVRARMDEVPSSPAGAPMR